MHTWQVQSAQFLLGANRFVGYNSLGNCNVLVYQCTAFHTHPTQWSIYSKTSCSSVSASLNTLVHSKHPTNVPSGRSSLDTKSMTKCVQTKWCQLDYHTLTARVSSAPAACKWTTPRCGVIDHNVRWNGNAKQWVQPIFEYADVK